MAAAADAPPTAAAPRWRRILVRVLREPLAHFFVVGLIILFSAQAWRAAHDERRIVVGDEQVAALTGKHRLQFGRAPTPAELDKLVEAYVDEEVLFREGRALGLDRDDEIVRRRVAQKVEFLRQDLTIPPEPSERDLQRFFDTRAARYAQPARVSFRHLYFSPDAGGSVAARTRAEQAFAALRRGVSPDSVAADAFPDQSSYAAVGPVEAARLFGASPLAAALATTPVGAWSGPFRSGYGWHLVFADGRYPGAPGDFAALRETVRGDYLREAQAAANARALRDMRARYTVVHEAGGRP